MGTLSKKNTRVKAIGKTLEIVIKKYRPASKSVKKNRERKRSK